MQRTYDKREILSTLEEHPKAARRLWVVKGYEKAFANLVDKARASGIPFRVIGKEEMERRFHQPKAHICLEREAHETIDQEDFLSSIRGRDELFLCAFDGIFDPQNLGNIVRSAACFGVDAIIIPKDRSCGITETVSRVSKGAIERIPVVKVTNLSRFLEEVKKLGVFCFGLDEKGSLPVWGADLGGRVCLVFGSEEGLRRLTRERCDEILTIPAGSGFTTLNVATAFAVSAYELMRQRSR